jgi:putative glutamine amidotransferase
MARRPRILITRAEAIASERWEDYGDAVVRAGADALTGDFEAWKSGEPMPAHDGLMLTAGFDIDPARFGEARSDRVQEVDARRDEFEVELIEAARADGRPILAICRGHQLLNVASGGSLLQHLEEREPHRARRGADGETIDSGWHEIEVVPETALARAIGLDAGGRVRANSRHHQAVTVDRVAPGLVVAATTPDGIVESLVDPSQPWVVSIQWHPEMAEMGETFDGVWRAFVQACEQYASESGA